MNKHETCGKPCNFWASLSGGNGECRKNPPTILPALVVHRLRVGSEPIVEAVAISTQYPITNSDDWCGAYEPDGGFRGPC